MQLNGVQERADSPATRDADKPWTNITAEQASVVHTQVTNDATPKRKHLNFFCNSTYYIAFRLLYVSKRKWLSKWNTTYYLDTL